MSVSPAQKTDLVTKATTTVTDANAADAAAAAGITAATAAKTATAKALADALVEQTAINAIVTDSPTPPPASGNQVSNLTAKPSGQGQVLVSWTLPSPVPATLTIGRDGVEAGGGAPNWSGSIAGTSTTVTFTNLADNTAYNFTVTPSGANAVPTTVKATTQAGTPVPPPPPPASGNGFAEAVAGSTAWYTKKLVPFLTDDFVQKVLDGAKWWANRVPGSTVTGPFNAGSEQACFTMDQVSLDGVSVLWISTAPNTTGKSAHPECAMQSGCIVTQNAYCLVGENTMLQSRVFFPTNENLNWQSMGGYGVTNGYPYELDWFELTGGALMVNKHTADANGNNTEIGQSNWGPSNPMDGQWHEIGIEWLPGVLNLFFDHKLVATRTIPRDRVLQKYSFTANTAVRNGSNPTQGHTMGVDWIVLSNIQASALRRVARKLKLTKK